MFDRINVDIADLYVDLTYGILLLIGIAAMIGTGQYVPAVTFGVGVLLAYAVHVGWRMIRFDPDVRGTIEETVERTVEDTVGETVEETVEETVGEKVEEVEETVEDTVEETVEKAVENADR